MVKPALAGSHVNPNADHVSHQSSNTANTNGGVGYLNVNNNDSNVNANIGSKLLSTLSKDIRKIDEFTHRSSWFVLPCL